MTQKETRIEQTVADILADGAILCIRLESGEHVVDACQAAIEGGLSVLELTLTTPGALDAIEALSKTEDIVIGAGTVLTLEDLAAVADRGARFVLSPIFNAEVILEANRRGVLAIPGAATPTEIYAAHCGGARMVKVFPAAPLGGPDFLRAVRGPLPHIPLVPTSGPNQENFHQYFDAGASAVGIGRELFPHGFTYRSITAASRRVRRALDAARSL